MKAVEWIGSSKKELLNFPDDVKQEIGYALFVAQQGDTYHSAKLLRGFSGIYEVVCDYRTDTFRAVYAVNIKEIIYVLHVFQKKSKTGIKTPKEEIQLIKQRLKVLKAQLKSGVK